MKNKVINIADYIFTFFLMIFTSRVIVSSLGVDQYAVYSAIGVTLMFAQAFEGGIGITLVQRFISEKNNIGSYLKTALVLYLLFSLILLVTFLLNQKLYLSFLDISANDQDILLVYIVLIISLISIYIVPFTSLIISKDLWGKLAFINVFSKATQLAFLLIASFFDVISLTVVLIINLGAVTIRFIFCFYLSDAMIFLRNSSSRFKFLILSEILSLSKYAALQYACVIALFYVDKVIFKGYFGLVEMSYLTFTMMVGINLHALYGAVYRTIFSKLVGLSFLNAVTHTLSAWVKMLCLSCVLTLFIYLSWEWVISILISREFAEGTKKYIPFILILVNIRTIEISLHFLSHSLARPKDVSVASLIAAILACSSYSFAFSEYGVYSSIVIQMVVILLSYSTLFLFYYVRSRN
ncbi:hypothetical protein AKJ18_04730 [Vibrio xuii]|nr:hypothetical protein AKJ18_04730 [Vibrio xuii]